ncbi:hypothetical protein AN641_09370 [Candidatus Epulonipiscioides gigas]|nr:hypothetical protein AN641_09370 [Epulopiscium sp. SCG-C07WGA-EpuloA2]
MDFKIGYSTYLSTFKEQKPFLDRIKKQGRIIFTSLHIPEEINSTYKNQILNMLHWLKERNFCVIGDISRRTLEQFDCTSIAEVANYLNIDMLRIDYGFSVSEIIEVAKQYPIVFNASTLDKKSIELLKNDVVNLKALHNFYPRAYTALSIHQFDKINRYLQNQKIDVYGFIPNINIPRSPIFEGLPTLEHQRHVSPYLNALEMWATGHVNCVLLGDLGLNNFELECIERFENEYIITVPIQLDKKYHYLYNKVFTIRIDSPDYVLRLQESREISTIGTNIEPYNCIIRTSGDITCDNAKYLRYSGEIQIIKTQLPKDDRVNVIGKINFHYKNICQFIPNGYKIKLSEFGG